MKLNELQLNRQKERINTSFLKVPCGIFLYTKFLWVLLINSHCVYPWGLMHYFSSFVFFVLCPSLLEVFSFTYFARTLLLLLQLCQHSSAAQPRFQKKLEPCAKFIFKHQPIFRMKKKTWNIKDETFYCFYSNIGLSSVWWQHFVGENWEN